MADVTYVSHVKLEPAEGKIRWAYVRRGERGGSGDRSIGTRARGGFSTKVHLRAEGAGKPVAFASS
jgi:hypothetical protein